MQDLFEKYEAYRDLLLARCEEMGFSELDHLYTALNDLRAQLTRASMPPPEKESQAINEAHARGAVAAGRRRGGPAISRVLTCMPSNL